MEEVGSDFLSIETVGQDLGIDVMGMMAFAFEYAGKQVGAGHEELFEMLHLSMCYGVITTARALKTQPLVDAA